MQQIDRLYNDVTIGKTKTQELVKTLEEMQYILENETLADTDKLKVYLIITNLYRLQGNSQATLQTAQKAYNFASKNKQYLWAARFLGYMSTVYRSSNMIHLGQQKLQEAINTASLAPNSEELNKFYANVYHEMAYYKVSNHDIKSSIEDIKLSNSYIEKMESANKDFLLASNYQYLGNLYNKTQQIDSAFFYSNKALTLLDGYDNINVKTLKNYILTQIGYSYLQENQYELAYNTLYKVWKDPTQFKTNDLNKELYTYLGDYYLYKKDIDSLRIFKQKLDSINTIIYHTNKDTIESVTSGLDQENNQLKKGIIANKWYYISSLFLISCLFVGLFVRKKHLTRNNSILKDNANELKTSTSPEILESPQVIEEKKNLKTEEINIAKETEKRLISQLETFEKDKLFLDKNMSISVLANHLNTNAKYITHILNKEYNQDFYTYINTLRIKFIVQLLKEEPKHREYKISYLAHICGFSSHSKFSEIFKKIQGSSPSQFIIELTKRNDLP
ncbi:helix-turn-helix domain-containing protein [Myroides sp. LJL116]